MKKYQLPNTDAPDVTERRRGKRVPLDVRVKLLLPEAGEGQVIHGRSIDISEGGMGVTLSCDLPKDAMATLIFKLPGEEGERRLQAQLKYRVGFRYGFRFIGMPGQKRGLLSFCSRPEQQG
jgi:c-di-GMP-binding flagellar brake protein YcgR